MGMKAMERKGEGMIGSKKIFDGFVPVCIQVLESPMKTLYLTCRRAEDIMMVKVSRAGRMEVYFKRKRHLRNSIVMRGLVKIETILVAKRFDPPQTGVSAS
jgi:hypothetical protein